MIGHPNTFVAVSACSLHHTVWSAIRLVSISSITFAPSVSAVAPVRACLFTLWALLKPDPRKGYNDTNGVFNVLQITSEVPNSNRREWVSFASVVT